MKLCTTLVVVAFALCVSLLSCTADQQGYFAARYKLKYDVDQQTFADNQDKNYDDDEYDAEEQDDYDDSEYDDDEDLAANLESVARMKQAKRPYEEASEDLYEDEDDATEQNDYEDSEYDDNEELAANLESISRMNQAKRPYEESEYAVKQNDEAAVIYKYVDEYERIWEDRGSGAYEDVSFWRPVDIENGFYLLGDTVHGKHGKPEIPSMTVSEGISGALSKPTGFTHIWDDRGSGARDDVRIGKLTARQGYTCLGHVAVAFYDTEPDFNKYRCVKNEYVSISDGKYHHIWNDRGSGAREDVSVYSNTNFDSADGRISNTFTAVDSYNTISGSPNLLRASTSSEKALSGITNEDIAIVVYQVESKERLWYDGGSGAYDDFASWRAIEPDGYYSLGDLGVASHDEPRFTIIAYPVKKDALAKPLYYREVWNDRGSGAYGDVGIWEPICPSGYHALGHVSVSSYDTRPGDRDIRCVKSQYTVQRTWKKIWDDSGSGAYDDVTVYEAVSVGYGQGVKAMSAVKCHCSMDRKAYVLDSRYIQYFVSRPIKKFTITNVDYDLSARNILSETPEVLASTILVNEGKTEQSATRVLTYSYQETHSWSISHGIAIGVEFSITAGVPGAAMKSFKTSFTYSFQSTTGGSVSETKQDQIRADIKVKPRSQKAAVVTASRFVIDVPYTATMVPEYADGTMGGSQEISGVYKGVQVSDVRVVYERDSPLDMNPDEEKKKNNKNKNKNKNKKNKNKNKKNKNKNKKNKKGGRRGR